MSWNSVPAAELMVKRGGSVNPSKFPDETFELFSIPAFDKNEPEILKGSEIGSSKSCIEPGDVLLSKIVPHIRRCWVVPKKGEHRQIGSGEWIIFRDERFDSGFLRHFLTSNVFHSQFMNTVAGVGGSLVRARPAGVELIEIPLPPLNEQKRIAAILDKADAIRRKREQAMKLADEFLRSVFLDMFGDPVINPKGFPVTKLGELCEDLFLGLTSKVDYIDGTDGYPLVRAKDINTGELSFEDVRYISEDQHKKLTKNHLTRKGDLLVSKSGTLGTCAIVRTDREFSTYESIFTVRPDSSRLDLHYLIHLLQNKGFKEKLIGNKVGGTVAHLNLKMFRDFEIGVPPIKLQRVFSNTIMKCEAKLDKYRTSGEESEFLFNSLSQKAFTGQF